MSLAITKKPWIQQVARTGLISKGIVYVLLGALGFMAAFEIGGQSNKETDKTGVFHSVKDFPGGMIILILLTAGLVCYSIWRVIQAFSKQGSAEIKWPKRARYFFSGLVYLSLAFTAVKMIFETNKNNGDNNQYWTSQILHHPFGQWMIGLLALLLAGVGIYQVYYGFSEKYMKHVQKLNLHKSGSSPMLRAGKIGYISRGIVWLILAWLMMQAALHNNSSEAGDTGKAFEFIEDSSFGSYLLGALGIGLIAYGVFNFIRARYETFK